MTEIIDSQFGGSALYSPINGINNLNTGNISLFAPKLSSIGFDGAIPSIKDTKNVELLKRGDYVLLQTSGSSLILGTDYTDTDSSIYLITSVFLEEPTDSQTTIKIIYNQQEEDVVLTNGDTAYYMSDDWTSRDTGTYGWQLTSAGNAIFNNVAVRGEINATSGVFLNTVEVGSGTNKISIVGTSSDSTTNIHSGSATKTSGPGFYIGADASFMLAGTLPTAPTTKIITAVAPSSPTVGKVTYTSASHGYTVGNSISIYGLYPYYYNGTYTITDVSTNTFSVSNSTTSTVYDSSGYVLLQSTEVAAALEIYSNGIAAKISDTQNKGVINIIGTDNRTVFDANDIQTFDAKDTSSPYSMSKLNLQRLGGDLQIGSESTPSDTYMFGDVYINGDGGTAIPYALQVNGTVEVLNNLRITGDISTVTNITATADIFATQFRATGGGGSATEVAFGFDGDSGFNSGLYFIAENSWGMSSGGTERLRFNTAGSIIMHGATDLADSIPASTSSGAAILYSGQILAAVQLNNSAWEGGGVPLTLQRASDTAALRDGTLVSFYRQGTLQGTISVVSTTVDYNSFAGSHWSQFKDNEMLDIYRGTVLELIDEKCEWYDSDGNLEENEQLMKVKISDTEASAGVYGVFHRYESEDLDNPNDMRVMSLGAYIIRVSSGETVSIGDLLESAGNGCARVQDDNLIKSSTIAKATGTTPVETYADGSYTIPCVLYCG